MKKNVQWAALLVALSLVFLACPQSDTKTTTIINWITPLNSLDISLGTNNDAIDFSFNETNPAAEKYILFHITGLVNTAASIISGGTSVEVTDITGTIGGFQPGTTHSFVVVAQYAGLPPSISPVKNITLTPFAIIIDDDIEGGRIESNKDEAAEGADVTLTLIAENGFKYTEDSLKINDEPAQGVEKVNGTNNQWTVTFTMPGEDVTITAAFEPILYDIIIDDEIDGGRIESDKDEAAEDEDVTLTLIADSGFKYTENSLKINDEPAEGVEKVNGTNNQWTVTFTMPGEDVTITAAFEPILYDVIIDDEEIEGGRIESDKDEAAEGEPVTLILTANEGYLYKDGTLSITGVSPDPAVTGTGPWTATFIMPPNNVTVNAVFSVLQGEIRLTIKTDAGELLTGTDAAISKPDGSFTAFLPAGVNGTWYLNGIPVEGTAKNSHTVNAADLRVGPHSLTVEVMIGGVKYAEMFDFEVRS